jgi:hypothetical protein
MITFKEEYIYKADTSIVLYIDGVSIIKWIVKDFSLNLNKKRDQKKFIKRFKLFFEKFLQEFLEVGDETIANELEFILKTESAQNVKRKLISFFKGSQINLDKVFEKSYFEFKSSSILYGKIEGEDDIHDLRDEISDSVLDSLELGNTSSGMSFLSIFFSKKFRYIADSDLKYEIFKMILKWVIGVVLGLLITYLILKLI